MSAISEMISDYKNEIWRLNAAISEATARAERAEEELKEAVLREQYARDQQVMGWLSAENFARIYPGLGAHVSLKVKKGKVDDVALYAHPFTDWEKHAEELRRLTEENAELKTELKAAREQEPYGYLAGRDFHLRGVSFVTACPTVKPLYASPIPAPAAQSGERDAYEGAREDLLDWKRRALEAERKLDHVLADINGPVKFGEPVIQAAQVPQGWTIRREGDVIIVQHSDVGGCVVQKEPDYDRMIPEAILWALARDMIQEVKS